MIINYNEGLYAVMINNQIINLTNIISCIPLAIAGLCIFQLIIYLVVNHNRIVCDHGLWAYNCVRRIALPVLIVILVAGICYHIRFLHNESFWSKNIVHYIGVLVLALILIAMRIVDILLLYRHNSLRIESVFCRGAFWGSSAVAALTIIFFGLPSTHLLFVFLIEGIILSVCCEYLRGLKYKEGDGRKSHSEELIDAPISMYDNLLPSRKAQLQQIASEISQMSFEQDSHGFAILIKGKWGSGKTSFVNGFEDYAKAYAFVKVSIGYEADIRVFLSQIEAQIRDIFKKNKFYNSSSKILEKYFSTICKLSDTFIQTPFGKIQEAMSPFLKDSARNKSELNDLLDDFYATTGKTIIIIIDDLERSPESSIKGVFSVLMETLKLRHCITILLCDYEQLIGIPSLSVEYLEKYFIKEYDLCELSVEEILDCIIKPELIKLEGPYISESDYNEYLNWYETFKERLNVMSEWDEDNWKVNRVEADFNDYAKKLEQILENVNVRTIKRLWLYEIRYLHLQKDRWIKLFNSQFGNVNYYKVALYTVLIRSLYPEIVKDLTTRKALSYVNLVFNTQTDILSDENRSLFYRSRAFAGLWDTFFESEIVAFECLLHNDISMSLDRYMSKRMIYTQEWESGKLNQDNITYYIDLFVRTNEDIVKISSFIGNTTNVSVDEIRQLLEKYYNLVSVGKGSNDAADNLVALLKKEQDEYREASASASLYMNEQARLSLDKTIKEVIANVNLSCLQDISQKLFYMSISVFEMEDKYTDLVNYLDGTNYIKVIRDIGDVMFEKGIQESVDILNAISRVKNELESVDEQDISLIEKCADIISGYVSKKENVSHIKEELSVLSKNIHDDIDTLKKWASLREKGTSDLGRSALIDRLFEIGDFQVSNTFGYISDIAERCDSEVDTIIESRKEKLLQLVSVTIRLIDHELANEEYDKAVLLEKLEACDKIYARCKKINTEQVISSYYTLALNIERLKRMLNYNGTQ